MKPNNGRKLFSTKPRTNSRPKPRTFDASNRSQWAH